MSTSSIWSAWRDDPVGDRLALLDAGDPLDDVVERLEVLDVDRRDDVDPGVEQLVDVLPALVVARAGHVGVGELVDQHPFRAAAEDGVDVHLLERRAAVLERAPWDDLEVADLLGGARPAVGLDEPDDDVGAALGAAPALVEHGERLADAGRGAEVDAQHTAPRLRVLGTTTGLEFGGHHDHSRSVSARRGSRLVERQVQLEHVDAGITEDAERPVGGVLLDEGEHVVDARGHARRRHVAPAAWRCAPRCAGRVRIRRR